MLARDCEHSVQPSARAERSAVDLAPSGAVTYRRGARVADDAAAIERVGAALNRDDVDCDGHARTVPVALQN